jgi:Flp pilus assembly protein TadB
MAERRPVKPGELMGLAAAAGQEARAAAARRRMAQVRLTDEERRIATDELAEQFAVGRLDEDELHRRVDLVNSAVTHGELEPALAGLPVSSLYTPPARRPGKWRWAAFAGAVWLAVPFVLAGLLFLVFGREIAAAIFGVPAVVWVAYAYRWASKPRRESGS